MAEEYRIAWIIYVSGVLTLLATGWWFMRHWGWGWLRWSLLVVAASVLLVPAQSTIQGSAPIPLLPLFAYQTVFEEGASPEVSASLVFALGGALLLLLVVGVTRWILRRRSREAQLMQEDPFFSDQ